MRAATNCELPARKLNRSMSSSTPTYSPCSTTATRRLLCLVILQQGARDEVVGLDRDDVVLGQAGDAACRSARASRIAALASRMPVSRPIRAPSRTNNALVLIARIVWPALAIVSSPPMKAAGCSGASRTRAPSSGLKRAASWSRAAASSLREISR